LHILQFSHKRKKICYASQKSGDNMAETWISFPELADVIGQDMARTLCACHGGVPFYVPQRGRPGSELERIIGPCALAALAQEYGGMYVTVPNGRKAEPYKARAVSLLEQGHSPRKVALQLGLTARYVRRLAQICNGPRQASLLDFCTR